MGIWRDSYFYGAVHLWLGSGKHNGASKPDRAPLGEPRGYTAHSGEDQKIVVMKIPGEDVNVLHTLIHEMSHARLEHLYKKDVPRGIAESEADLSTYLVGAHFVLTSGMILQPTSKDGWIMPNQRARTWERRTLTG